MKLFPIFIVIIGLTLSMGCPAKNKLLDEEVIGVWKTQADQYADRFMELQKTSIIFGTGDGTISPHPIRGVEKDFENNQSLYTIFYLNLEGQEYSFSFTYLPNQGGTIFFKNQPNIIWQRKKI